MVSTVIRRGLGLAALLLALPGVSWAAETAVKALSSCGGGTCPLGCC